MPKLTSADRIKIVVDDLRAVIDALDRNFTSVKSLILKVARLATMEVFSSISANIKIITDKRAEVVKEAVILC